MQETQVLSLGREDLLEEGMTALSIILAWRILSTEEPSRLQPNWGRGAQKTHIWSDLAAAAAAGDS